MTWISYACPTSGESLDEAFHCKTSQTTYPTLGGVFFGFPAPLEAIADWRNRWRLERQRLHNLAQQSAQEAKSAKAFSRARLKQLASGYGAQLNHVQNVLSPILGDDTGGARETLTGLRTRLPSHHAPTSYADNVCRDWVWGQDELQRQLTAIQSKLPSKDARILVLGAGAGRLCAELSRTHRHIAALDSNPFLMLVAAALQAGETLPFVEFPKAPKQPGDFVVEHQLQGIDSQVSWICADALNPPFAAASFDVVITPWLIDVIDAPLTALTRTVNVLLAPGGRWINDGSLAFMQAAMADNHGPKECAEVLAEGGFVDIELMDEERPYMSSPYSRQRRWETLLCWQATKSSTAQPAAYDHLPAWLIDARQPIPQTQSFALQSASVRVHAFIMSLIDGKRSLNDMANELARQGLMPQEEALASVRGFVKTMWEESQQGDA